MAYFVTGASGFVGRHLLEKLFARSGHIYLLVRSGSKAKLKKMLEDMDAPMKRIDLITGDLTKNSLGVTKKNRDLMTGKVKHFYHLAAIYDMNAGLEEQMAANVDGTSHAIHLAEAIKGQMLPSCVLHCCCRHVSGGVQGGYV